MLISDFLDQFAHELPLALAMPDDPVGVQVLAEDRPLTSVAVAYEVTEHVVAMADEAGAELIIAFHPLLYPALKRITHATRVERTVVELIRRGIGLLVVHTAFDAHPEGTSALVARRLGLHDVGPLVPDVRRDGAGMGAIGDLGAPMTLEAFAGLVREACGAPAVRISHPLHGAPAPDVRRVAILGGSGMSFYDEAVRSGADVLVTADVRYHGFHAANDRIAIVDPGHAESERFVAQGMAALVERTIARTGMAVSVRLIDEPTNPVRFVM